MPEIAAARLSPAFSAAGAALAAVPAATTAATAVPAVTAARPAATREALGCLVDPKCGASRRVGDRGPRAPVSDRVERTEASPRCGDAS
ncbi:hypothetical protein GCM10009547_04260 [Sporichthya brevicatena]|uniref:Uncharacterized protein n=1 Tax=Sporichthya brevicatena TaxID=171442 RepID=A0ABP3RDR7_9ACTN